MMAQSSEFGQMAIREEELPELDALARDACHFDIKGGPENKHGKVNILLQVSVKGHLLHPSLLVQPDPASFQAQKVRVSLGCDETAPFPMHLSKSELGKLFSPCTFGYIYLVTHALGQCMTIVRGIYLPPNRLCKWACKNPVSILLVCSIDICLLMHWGNT